MSRKGRNWSQWASPEQLRANGIKANAVSRARGNLRIGERCPWSKLTEADVLRMRELAAEHWTYAAIARFFGVSRPTARRAIAGESWAHVPFTDDAARESA